MPDLQENRSDLAMITPSLGEGATVGNDPRAAGWTRLSPLQGAALLLVTSIAELNSSASHAMLHTLVWPAYCLLPIVR